jgi:hypothetical protein
MEFSAAILSTAVPERRSRCAPMRATGQPRAPGWRTDKGHLTSWSAGSRSATSTSDITDPCTVEGGFESALWAPPVTAGRGE